MKEKLHNIELLNQIYSKINGSEELIWKLENLKYKTSMKLIIKSIDLSERKSMRKFI